MAAWGNSPMHLPAGSSELTVKTSRFASRLDKGLLPILLFFPLILCLIGVWVFFQSPWIGVMAVLLALVQAVASLVYIWPCYYQLTDTQLEVRCGFTRVCLPYKDIHRVDACNASIPSPALSLRRLVIESNQGFLLVSPVNRNKFQQELSLRMHGRFVGDTHEPMTESADLEVEISRE